MTPIEMVEKFQCPGCVCGSDTKCGEFAPSEEGGKGSIYCKSHVLGTVFGLGNNIALGLPKGFNKPGPRMDKNDPRFMQARNQMEIRLWPKGMIDSKWWNKLNVPVWAMVMEGFLFVRTYAPRVNFSWVDVVEGEELNLVSGAINVADFLDEID